MEDIARHSPGCLRTIFTIGHSTRTTTEFVGLLREIRAEVLVDVRSIPRSRTNPQFNIDVLPEALAAAGIGYRHLLALGGLRHRPRSAMPSPNMLWRNSSFQNFADYAATNAFRDGLTQLAAHARDKSCVIMCAEAVPWRCHRSLIGDALLVRGVRLEEITSRTRTRPHTITPWARVRGKQLSYPANPEHTKAVAREAA